MQSVYLFTATVFTVYSSIFAVDVAKEALTVKVTNQAQLYSVFNFSLLSSYTGVAESNFPLSLDDTCVFTSDLMTIRPEPGWKLRGAYYTNGTGVRLKFSMQYVICHVYVDTCLIQIPQFN